MTTKLQVYWDGQCPFCAAISSRLPFFDEHRRIELVDYNNPEVAATALPRFSFDDLNTEMHVAMPNGTWRIGYWGWSAVLAELPKFKWFARIMNLPIFADIGPKAYRWIADHRLVISKALGLPPPCDSTGACRIPSAPNKVPASHVGSAS